MDPNSNLNASPSPVNDMDHMRRFEGQLNKFTNVVKGWQYRWFVLEPAAGVLEYYLLEERSGRCRGSQMMAGAVVSPSQEDENTFSINFRSGETYKVRASSARERQVWVDRLRHCIFMHSDNIDSHGSDFPDAGVIPLTSRDSFGSVHDALHVVFNKEAAISSCIDNLPVPKLDDNTSPSCYNPELLMIKANAQALASCLQNSLDILYQIREQQLIKPSGNTSTHIE